MDNIHLLLANSGQRLKKNSKNIKSAFLRASTLASTELNLQNVDVIVVANKFRTESKSGIGGYTPFTDTVEISINDDENIPEHIIFETMIHELHHAARWSGVGYGKSLGEAVVSEGLATYFEGEYSLNPPLHATTTVTRSHWIQLKENLADDDSPGKHGEWFFGSSSLPNWLGYSMGYTLVRDHLKQHNIDKSALIWNLDADTLLSGIDKYL